MNGSQLYRCKACRKAFRDITNTILHHTRKDDEWITFIECMFKGYSLRKSTEVAGVTWVTLFHLNHLIVSLKLTRLIFVFAKRTM